jgi:hypothetical protein
MNVEGLEKIEKYVESLGLIVERVEGPDVRGFYTRTKIKVPGKKRKVRVNIDLSMILSTDYLSGEKLADFYYGVNFDKAVTYSEASGVGVDPREVTDVPAALKAKALDTSMGTYWRRAYKDIIDAVVADPVFELYRKIHEFFISVER